MNPSPRSRVPTPESGEVLPEAERERAGRRESTRDEARARCSPSALRDKYEKLLELRLACARARMEGMEGGSGQPLNAAERVQPRTELAALAQTYPGALREIDHLPLRVIEERIAALRAAERDPRAVTPWMVAQSAFHRLARGALAAKRWLAGRRVVDTAELTAFARELEACAVPDEARAWASDLASLARPPRGRVMDLVFRRLATELQVHEGHARELVWGCAASSNDERPPPAS